MVVRETKRSRLFFAKIYPLKTPAHLQWKLEVKYKMTQEQKTRIAELRGKGFGYAKIASALSLTKDQVVSYCRRNRLAGEIAPSEDAEKAETDYCKNCGKVIRQVPGRKAIKFCSDECCRKWWNTHSEAVTKQAFYSFTCKYCGRSFTAYGNSHRKYCSHACYIFDRFGGESHD